MSDEDLLKWSCRCRRAGGVPTVRTRFAGEPLLSEGGEHFVVASCYGAADVVKGGLFTVSRELWEELDRSTDDWRLLERLARERGIC